MPIAEGICDHPGWNTYIPIDPFEPVADGFGGQKILVPARSSARFLGQLFNFGRGRIICCGNHCQQAVFPSALVGKLIPRIDL